MTINRYRYFYERAFSLFGDHTRCFIEKLAEQEHAASTIKLYLSCINDVAKAMDAAGLSACDLDEPRAIELVATMGWIQSRETYANFMLKRFVSFLADRGVGRERPALSPKEVARSELRVAYEDYLRRQRGLSERTIIDSWRFAEKFLDFRFPEDADELGKISVSDIARFLQARTVNKASSRPERRPRISRFRYRGWRHCTPTVNLCPNNAQGPAGVRGDLSEGERGQRFAGHSLRAGLASSAEVDERYVQKQLGHTSAEMTRKYQRRRDRFRVNLTKASGLCERQKSPPLLRSSIPSLELSARTADPSVAGRSDQRRSPCAADLVPTPKAPGLDHPLRRPARS
jgi:hypothetical protein